MTDWILGWLPCQCQLCNRWLLRRDRYHAPHRLAGFVTCCEACYYELYPDRKET